MVIKNIRAEEMEVKMEVFDNIAISSRIRLARNVDGLKFYTKLQSDEDANYIICSIMKTLEENGSYSFLCLKNLSLNECNALFEQHLISKELIENKDISAVAISEDEKVVVMINEEDHIREQCLEKGFNLYKPYRRILEIDKAILNAMPIAFSEKYGFITASPSNLGSGMRASVMLFLPAHYYLGKIDEVVAKAKEEGLTIRGCYGEGSRALGQYYQISNQSSLGLDENEIIDKVSDFIYKLCIEEKEQREYLLENDFAKYKDMCLRAYGTITNCYTLTSGEMVELLSLVKFAQVLGFVDIINEDKFQKLFHEGGEANLKEIFELNDKKEENILRAEYISNKVKEFTVRR